MNIPTHYDLYGNVLKGWRWNFDRCIDWSVYSNGNLEDGDFDLVREHLRRKYKIYFYENRYHDLEFFNRKLKEEKLNK